ncbi:MAG: DUF2167 domain-containing protein [Verrucomicrobiota bacterium]|jgi:uncharacterized membrane-anchored protein
MNACLPSNSKWRIRTASFCILPILAVFLSQPCTGEQLSLAPVRTPDMPSQAVSWISGPKQASLGTLADIEVPQGYRLTGEAGARFLLERMKNPVPDGLIGILTPDSGKWWVVLTFTGVGYVKNADKELMDPAAVLKAVQKQTETQNSERAEQGMDAIISVDWEHPPVYDAEKHSLEWALRAETQSSKVVNDAVLLLGRRGVLEIITVQPKEVSSETIPLQSLAKKIAFKEGQRYADYENGDKIADVNLAQLVVNDKQPTGSRNLMTSSWTGMVVWIYVALAGCVVMIGGMLLYQKRRQRRVHSAIYASGAHPIAAARASSGNGHGNGSGSVTARPDAQKVDGTADDRGKLRRKKVFDYSKFYTHVVMELSSRSNAGVGPMPNGRSNNYASGTNNGAANQTIAEATLDLIASQKNLIEEQKHLMQQQTRLIEERRKLIEEQNTLLRRQAEMIESQYSLKLD